MDFGNYVFLKKNLSDFGKDHPLLVWFEVNPKCMDNFESLFKEVDDIPNLANEFKKMKNDFQNWESFISELKFARKVKVLNPAFINEKDSRTPDLKVSLLGKEIFFEVRLFNDMDKSRRIYEEIYKIESDLIVSISLHDVVLDEDQTDTLIKSIKDKVKSSSQGTFPFDEYEIKIMKKVSSQSKRTALVISQCAKEISSEPIRKKIFQAFYKKLSQLESCKPNPIFLVIDCKKWQYDDIDLRRAVYGIIQYDKTVGMTMLGFSDITKRAATNWELYNDSRLVPEGLVPTLLYPDKKGLFFLNDASCLCGVVGITLGDGMQLLINPFAEQQLDTKSIRQLQETLEHEES
jgi:hypothetical protein